MGVFLLRILICKLRGCLHGLYNGQVYENILDLPASLSEMETHIQAKLPGLVPKRLQQSWSGEGAGPLQGPRWVRPRGAETQDRSSGHPKARSRCCLHWRARWHCLLEMLTPRWRSHIQHLCLVALRHVHHLWRKPERMFWFHRCPIHSEIITMPTCW